MTQVVITLPCSTCGTRLEIPDLINRFVCAHCGCEQQVLRSGGIVALSPVMHGESGGCMDTFSLTLNKVQVELRDTRLLYEKEIKTTMLDVPIYVLLKPDFQRLGKIGIWNMLHVSDAHLEKIFRALTLDELDRLISIYEKNPRSPTRAWLVRMRELHKQLLKLEGEIERLRTAAARA